MLPLASVARAVLRFRGRHLSRAHRVHIPRRLLTARPPAALPKVTMSDSPNENSRIFSVAGRPVLPPAADAGIHFGSRSDAEAGECTVASRLFDLPPVTAVFLGPTWLSVNCVDGTDWGVVEEAVSDIVLGQAATRDGEADPLYTPPEGFSLVESAEYDSEDEEIVEDIIEILETRVRPTVQNDGGDVYFQGYRDGVVSVRLAGSCDGCAMSEATLQEGIERMLQHYVPEVERVQSVRGPEQMASDAAFAALEQRLADQQQRR